MSSKVTTLAQMQAAAARSLQASGVVAQAAAEAIEEALDVLKQNKSQSLPVTIPTDGWSLDESADDESEEATDETSEYPYYYDIAVEGVTANDQAGVTVLPASIAAATACGLCPANETLAGAIRMRAVSIPTEAISAEYWIEDGKES